MNRHALKKMINQPLFVYGTAVLIILNAAVLGMETYPALMDTMGPTLKLIDQTILWIFVGELILRFTAYGIRFFRDPWAVFDFVVIAIAFVPTHQVFSVLRAARILRVLRLVALFPRLKRVVEGFLSALPGIGSIAGVLAITMYVFAVMATKLFSQDYPDWFGSLHQSIFSLFQIMTLEGWPDMVRGVMKTHPYAWIFFITFILIGTFSMLNLFIAVIVDAMQRKNESDQEQKDSSVHADLEHLKHEMRDLKTLLIQRMDQQP